MNLSAIFNAYIISGDLSGNLNEIKACFILLSALGKIIDSISLCIFKINSYYF